MKTEEIELNGIKYIPKSSQIFKPLNDTEIEISGDVFVRKDSLKNVIEKEKLTLDQIKKSYNTFDLMLNYNGDKKEDIIPYSAPKNKRQFAANDRSELDYVAEFLQQGWEANWNNRNEPKWFPRFEHNGASGFGFLRSTYGAWNTYSSCGSRLSFPDEATSDYFGKQFIAVHNRLLTNKY